MHAARLLKYKPETTLKSRIPKHLETHDEGDELGEELCPPRIEIDLNRQTRVKVTVAQPVCDIVDIRPPKTPNNTEKEEEKAQSKVVDEEQERGGANEETTPEPHRKRARSESVEKENRDTKTKWTSHDPPERGQESNKIETKKNPESIVGLSIWGLCI